MPSPLALIVHKRFGWIALFLVLASIPIIWTILISVTPVVFFFVESHALQDVELILYWSFITALILHIIAVFFSFTLAMGWNLQFKVSFRFRPGMLIKYIFWITGLLTVHSGITAYLLVIEKTNLSFWPLLAHFAFDFAALIISMTVRYAIDEDVKKRKICEFC